MTGDRAWRGTRAVAMSVVPRLVVLAMMRAVSLAVVMPVLSTRPLLAQTQAQTQTQTQTPASGAAARSAARSAAARTAAAVRSDALAARSTLDGWLVTRYRDAQLLEDTLGGARPVTTVAPYPRVESARAAPSGDTLFAVHFSAGRGEPPLRNGGTVRLSEPSGAISSQSARVLVRRPFRAPAMPGATLRPGARSDKAGRYGWGYLLVVTRSVRRAGTAGVGRAPVAAAWRGWLLVEPPDTLARRADTSRSAVGTGGATTRGALRPDSLRADSIPPRIIPP